MEAAHAPTESPRPLSTWRIVLRVAILAWLGLVVLVATNQRSMIYFPQQAELSALEPQAREAGWQPWRDSQGNYLGWSRPAPGPGPARAALVILHGNGDMALPRTALYGPLLDAASWGSSLDLHVLEYPGYGARPGEPSEQALVQAAAEALDTLPSGQPVILLGESLGTGVASLAAASRPEQVSGLLLVTPFDSLVSAAAHHYPFLPVGWILRDRFDSAGALQGFRGPVAILLAGQDEVVPAELGRRLHEGLPGPKMLREVASAGHNNVAPQFPPEGWREMLNFLLPPAR